MKAILGILGGAGGGWILAAALLASAALGGGAAWKARAVIADRDVKAQENVSLAAQRDTETCKATHQKGRADGAEKVIDALQQSAVNVTEAMNALAAKAAARGKSLDQFLKELANAPSEKICAASAAELALRRSLQPGAPGTPAF